MNAARKNNKCARNKLCSAQKFIPHPREHIRRRRFFSQCAYKYLSAPIYTFPRAKTYYVAQNYLLNAPKNIRCADLFSKCAEKFVIVCEGTKPASRAYIIDPSRHRATPAGCAVNCLACQRFGSCLISVVSAGRRYATLGSLRCLTSLGSLRCLT